MKTPQSPPSTHADTHTSDSTDPYADIAELYDLEHADFADDLALYVNVAISTGDPILELGCGSGRVLLALADAGFQVTGLDQSAPMLARARSAVAEAGLTPQVTLHQGDMTDAASAPGGRFGIVILSLNGLLHAPSSDGQRAILTAAHEALDPRGQLILDVLNPTPDVLKALETGVTLEGMWTLPDGVQVQKFSFRRVAPTEQRIYMDLWYDLTDSSGSVRRVGTQFAMRYLHPAELALMLELSGFVEWEMYGSYDLDPLDDASERLIVTAEVSRSVR